MKIVRQWGSSIHTKNAQFYKRKANSILNSKQIFCSYSTDVNDHFDFSGNSKNKSLLYLKELDTAQFQLQKKEILSAKKQFAQASSLHGLPGLALIGEGKCLFELGNYDDAISCFTKVLEMHSAAHWTIPKASMHSFDVSLEIAMALYHRGKCFDMKCAKTTNLESKWEYHDRAIYDFTKAKEIMSSLDVATRTEISLNTNPMINSLPFYSSSVDENISKVNDFGRIGGGREETTIHALCLLRLAGLSYRFGRFDEAIDLAKKAIKEDQYLAAAYVLRGM